MHKLVDGVRVVAFDLDGTLVDTAPDLVAAANMMLATFGDRPLSEHCIRGLIGDGVDSLVAKVLDQSPGPAAPDSRLLGAAAALFRTLYDQHLFERSRIYPGVLETLRALQSAAIRACCITNKESRFALPLLEAAGLHELLAITLCADRPEDRKPSPNLLLAACTQMGIKPAQMLYVGDSRSDIVAAQAAGCRVIAVSYGYHHDLPLAQARPDGIVEALTEITSICALSAVAGA